MKRKKTNCLRNPGTKTYRYNKHVTATSKTLKQQQQYSPLCGITNAFVVNEIDPYFWPTDNLTVCLYRLLVEKNIFNNIITKILFFFLINFATTGVRGYLSRPIFANSRLQSLFFFFGCTDRQSWLCYYNVYIYRYCAGAAGTRKIIIYHV